jgi:hypothetical protein
MTKKEPNSGPRWEQVLALADHISPMQAPQDTNPTPSLADVIAPDPIGALARRVKGLIAISERFKDRAGAAELGKAIDLLLAVLEAEGGITFTQRDVAFFEVGRTTGRWEAQEEAKGGVLPRRVTAKKHAANARASTTKARAKMRDLDEAIERLSPIAAAERTIPARVAKLRELLRQDGFDPNARGTSAEKLRRHPLLRTKRVTSDGLVKRSLH